MKKSEDEQVRSQVMSASRRENMYLGFLPGPKQTRLYNFGFKEYRDCTIYTAKTKVLISCTLTAQLICVFVLVYAKNSFSHDAAHMMSMVQANQLGVSKTGPPPRIICSLVPRDYSGEN